MRLYYTSIPTKRTLDKMLLTILVPLCIAPASPAFLGLIINQLLKIQFLSKGDEENLMILEQVRSALVTISASLVNYAFNIMDENEKLDEVTNPKA